MGNRQAGTFIIIFFCLSCSLNDERNQYIVSKNGNNLEPYAQVTYKINTGTGTIFYWTEKKGQKRSQLHQLRNCKVTDLNNWEGVADDILLWRVKVKFDNGKFNSMGAGLENVDWFTWNFRTASNLNSLLKFPDPSLAIWGVFAILGILGIIIGIRAGLRKAGKGHRKCTLGRQLLGRAKTKSSSKIISESNFPVGEESIGPKPGAAIPIPEIYVVNEKNLSPAQEFSGEEGVQTQIQERLGFLEGKVTKLEDMLAPLEENLVNYQEQLKSDPQIDLQTMLMNLDGKHGKLP